MTSTATRAAEPASPVRWEPCEAPRADEPGTSVCVTCGWLVEDHALDAPPAQAA